MSGIGGSTQIPEAKYETIRTYEVRLLESNTLVGSATLCMLADSPNHQILFKGQISIGTPENPKNDLEGAILTYPNMVANETRTQLIEIAKSKGCYFGRVQNNRNPETLQEILPALNEYINRQ